MREKQKPRNAEAGEPHGVVVRETMCRTILNRTSISDYSLNCYTGCEHGCVYCYARYMQRFHPHPEPWGGFVDVKVNAAEALERQLRRAQPGEVFVSSACDGWQPIEARYGLTRGCCRLLTERGFAVHALTKSALVLRDLDLFAGSNAQIGVTVATLDEQQRAVWEPRSSTLEERFQVIEKARQAGLKTAIMFGPLLPFLSDSPGSVSAMFQRAADQAVDCVWVDALNARPKVWPSVVALLRERFPDLCARYARILFQPVARQAYLAQLRDRVARATQRFGLNDRVSVCF